MKNGVRVCRRPGDLCTADPNFKFDLTNSVHNSGFVRFPISDLFPFTSSLLISDTTFTPSIPVQLKLGDADLDGFPDMLIIPIEGRDKVPHLVYSVPCAVGVAGCGKDGSGRRGWKIATKGTEALQKIKDAKAVAFLDMDEDVSCFQCLSLHSIFDCDLFTGHTGHYGSAHR